MKKFLIFILVLAILVGGGLFALTQFISVDKVKSQVVESVKKATGRDIAFDAMQPAIFFPNVGLRLRKVTFSNAPWAHDKNMLELEELDLHLALKPLLSKQVQVAKLMLKKPVIHLETSTDGKGNWEFPKAAKDKGEEKEPAEPSAGSKMASGFKFKFGQMQISGGGVLTYRDGKKGTVTKLDGVNASLTWPEFENALQVDGEFNYKGKRVNVLVNLEKPLAFSEGKTSGGDLQVKGDGFTFKIDGNFASAGTMLSGKVDVSLPELSAFAGWLQGGKTKLPFEKCSFTSAATASASSLKLNGIKLKLDDVNAGGDVTVGLGGKPTVTAKLSLDKLNLDRFMQASKETAAVKGDKAAAAPRQQDWDDTPMNFGGLKAFDADFTLKTDGFSVKGAEVGPSTLTAQVNGGVLRAKSSEAKMFSGTVSTDLTVNAAGPSLGIRFNLSGVQAEPVLTTFANFKKLDGTAYMTADLASSGNSQKAIINNLAGKGTFDFKNGSLKGIDLANFAKLIQNRLQEMNIGEGKTEFVDMGGTYTVAKGIAHNEDLKMRGPLVQATGSGDINLPEKSIKYRVLPVLTASSAVENAKGLKVPVDIKGPFSNIKVKPDYKGMISDVLGNPENAQETIKNIRTQGKDIIKDFKKDPNKALNMLLGIPAPAPAEPDAAQGTAPDAAPAPEPAPEPVPGPP
ncbi:MAG: AsmA family protein [Alphaproteobacteria bacterium]|nr:MAG: AsmA family protein [Alphaproteobacteria bacterium]